MLLARERVDEELEADRESERLVRALLAERNEIRLLRETREHRAVGDLPHRHVGDDGISVAARNRDRQRVRAGELRPARRRAEPTRGRRRERGDESAVGEPAHPVAEHPRRERPASDDHPRARRRIRERRPHDRVERQVAERAVAVPLLVSRLAARRARAWQSGSMSSSVSSQSTRESPWPALPRCSASTKWSASIRAAASSNPSERSRSNGSRNHYDSSVSGFTMPPGRSSATRAAISCDLRRDERLARVARLANARVERDRAEQRHAELLGERLAAAAAEDVAAHVLHDAEQPHRGLLRHERGPRSDLLRRRLRRRHDDHLGARQQLAERDRDVSGPGRHVDDEHVELAPVHVREKLLERAMQHRPAPHHRLVVVEEEADRHQLHVVLHRRHDHLVHGDRLLVDAEQVRDRVSVDVGVEDPDAQPVARERRREVRRDRRLADAALPRAHREHARRSVERESLRALAHGAAQLPGQRLTLVRGHHVEAERHLFDAVERRRPRAAPDPRSSSGAGSRRR